MSTDAALTTRIGFVVELARRLHEYGTAAPRLEDVINLVSAKLELSCNALSTPTSIVMSFSDRSRGEDALAEITQVIRLSPGDSNLKRLCQVDEIADQVIEGRLDIHRGYLALREVATQRPTRPARVARMVAYGISSASVATILHTGWTGVATASLTGLAIGVLSLSARKRPNIANAFEALSALLATLIATLIAVYVTPLAVRSVVIASLVVLLPGMMLTTAVRELSSQHLIAGVARVAGAVAILLKLAFGTVAAAELCKALGLVPGGVPSAAVPAWTEWLAVIAGAFSFAILFRSPLRHFPTVIAAVMLGYACTHYAGGWVSPEFGVFVGGLVIGGVSNAFARIAQRPGALVRDPGIILLVPGSVGFRTLSFVFERDVMLGIDTAVSLMTLLVALVAGLLFGDLVVPPRRTL
jgi:uncharacterized membrane protein YjjP (DUF1212 family)